MVVEKLKEREDKRDNAQDELNLQAELITAKAKLKRLEESLWTSDPWMRIVINIDWMDDNDDAIVSTIVDWMTEHKDDYIEEKAAKACVNFLTYSWIKYWMAMNKKLWANKTTLKSILRTYISEAEDFLDNIDEYIDEFKENK